MTYDTNFALTQLSIIHQENWHRGNELQLRPLRRPKQTIPQLRPAPPTRRPGRPTQPASLFPPRRSPPNAPTQRRTLRAQRATAAAQWPHGADGRSVWGGDEARATTLWRVDGAAVYLDGDGFDCFVDDFVDLFDFDIERKGAEKERVFGIRFDDACFLVLRYVFF